MLPNVAEGHHNSYPLWFALRYSISSFIDSVPLSRLFFLGFLCVFPLSFAYNFQVQALFSHFAVFPSTDVADILSSLFLDYIWYQDFDLISPLFLLMLWIHSTGYLGPRVVIRVLDIGLFSICWDYWCAIKHLKEFCNGWCICQWNSMNLV